VQWTALVLCVLLAVGIVECLRGPWTVRGMRWGIAPRLGRVAAGTICILWLAAASVWAMRWMLAIADVKRIDAAFRDVGAMAQRVPPGSAITVRDLPLGPDGFFAMWIPYFIRDNPVFFEWGEASANYLSVLVRHSARVPLAHPPYVLARAGSQPIAEETPILGNRRFWLFAVHTDTPQPALGPAKRVPLSVDGIAAVVRVDGTTSSADGAFTLSAGAKTLTIIGSALLIDPRTCPREVYLGLADPEGTVVLMAPAERYVWSAYVSAFDLPPEAACGFRARVDTGGLRPGTYYFRVFQLTPDRGFYTNPIGDPRLVVTR
jgi:hypothetical protein